MYDQTTMNIPTKSHVCSLATFNLCIMVDADGAPTVVGTAVGTPGETMALAWTDPLEGLDTMVETPFR